MAAKRSQTKRADGGTVGNIGVKDPFQLIRHLARSQGDPRKAVAELVQNALDEQARRIVLERRRESGEAVLSILDDGVGVLPAAPRQEALETIARSIGHSRKRQLSFDERMRQAMLGQYGIGLLGFWSLGHELRMYSRVQGSEVWVLTLWEDSPRFEVERAPDLYGLDRGETWTEVQVRSLHSAAMQPTVGSRLASYLSVELRGQLLRHGTVLELYDRIARGAADKKIVVKPLELAGERLQGLDSVQVKGFEFPIDLQLHYAGETEPGTTSVKLACAGAIVLDDLGEHPSFARPPWTDGRVAGIIDFPHLEVPPGSRRGYVPNDAANAFEEALRSFEPMLLERLAEKDRQAAAKLTAEVHKQLAKLFSRAADSVPHLEWFPIARTSGKVTEAPAPPEGEAMREPAAGATEADEDGGPQQPLFAPGPLAEVRITPAKAELARGHARQFAARAFDAVGVRIPEGVTYQWSAEGAAHLAATQGAAATVEAAADAEPGSARLTVIASEGDTRVAAEALLRIVAEATPKRADTGIPTPEELNEPLQGWRSRTVGERWQINVGHPDYRTAAGVSARVRIRYLAFLLAKEIISRNFPRPEVGQILEEMVGLLAAIDRTGAWTKAGAKSAEE